MNVLSIQKSQSTPSVEGEWEQGVLTMEGDSYPENSLAFFGQIDAWIQRYLKESSEPLLLKLRLVYMNTSSVRAMMGLFDRLEEAHGRGRAVRVNWYYDPRNERILRLVEEFREDCSFPFEVLVDAR